MSPGATLASGFLSLRPSPRSDDYSPVRESAQAPRSRASPACPGLNSCPESDRLRGGLFPRRNACGSWLVLRHSGRVASHTCPAAGGKMAPSMNASSVRLTNFKLRAYRSCKSTSFAPDTRVTALIGSNGSGKTNVLQGLMLLCGVRANPYRPGEDDLFALKSQIFATFSFDKKSVYLRRSVVYRPTDQNRDQLLYSHDEWNFEEISGKRQWLEFPSPEDLRYGSYGHHMNRRWYISHRRSGSGIVRRPVEMPKASKKIWDALNAIHDFQSRTAYYSASQFTNPAQCPSSFEIDEDGDLYEQESFSTRSRDHLQFIYQLYRMRERKESLYESYMSLVDERGLGLIQKIKWRENKYSTKAYEVRAGGKVISKSRKRFLIIPTVHIGDSELSFAQLSEGSFRTLAILFYVVTDTSCLLLIEEPEVCVHHGLLTSVVEIIKDFARKKQVIFSTHSENILDQLEPEQVRLVRKDIFGTTISTISERMSAQQFRALKKYLQTEGNLGEYWRSSGFSE
jgi:ABC-type Mn2+/Zn2+ transport system ATPase subunit